MTETYARPTEYKVGVFPGEMCDSGDMLTASEADTWSLTVVWRGRGKWAVCRGGGSLGADGTWDWDSREQDDEWLAAHRFDLDTALKLAAEHAPKITVNGKTALEILAKLRQREGTA